MTFFDSFNKVWAEPAGKAIIGTASLLLIATVAVSTAINKPSKPTSPKEAETSSVETAPTPVETASMPVTTFDISQGWNSEYNTKALETSIKESAADTTTGVEKTIASVTCKATNVKPIFNCKIRQLGIEAAADWRIEIDFKGDTWAGHTL